MNAFGVRTRNSNLIFIGFVVAAISCSVVSSSTAANIPLAERTTSTTIAIEKVDLLQEKESVDGNEKVDIVQDDSRHLQQYMPYCSNVKVKIECTNLKSNEDCRKDIVTYNPNSCYLYLKYKIAVTNIGNNNAKIKGLSRQLNGSEQSFLKMIGNEFVLEPGVKITISRTEWLNYCKEKFIGTGAEVMADVEEGPTCVNHDFYVIFGE